MGHPAAYGLTGWKKLPRVLVFGKSPPKLAQYARLGWGSHRDLIAQMGHLYVYQWVDVVVLSG
jgi:hypothetical protein